MASLRKIIFPTLPRNFRGTVNLTAFRYKSSNLQTETIVPLEKPKPNKAIEALEEGSWTELNKVDKVAMYRDQFTKTLKEESKKSSSDGAKIFLSVSILIALGLVTLFAWISIIEPPPSTQESQEAQKRKAQIYMQRVVPKE